MLIPVFHSSDFRQLCVCFFVSSKVLIYMRQASYLLFWHQVCDVKCSYFMNQCCIHFITEEALGGHHGDDHHDEGDDHHDKGDDHGDDDHDEGDDHDDEDDDHDEDNDDDHDDHGHRRRREEDEHHDDHDDEEHHDEEEEEESEDHHEEGEDHHEEDADHGEHADDHLHVNTVESRGYVRYIICFYFNLQTIFTIG